MVEALFFLAKSDGPRKTETTAAFRWLHIEVVPIYRSVNKGDPICVTPIKKKVGRSGRMIILTRTVDALSYAQVVDLIYTTFVVTFENDR